MAEINVERKRARIWPWIVGLLILAALVWVVMEMLRREGALPGTADTVDADTAAFISPSLQAAPPSGLVFSAQEGSGRRQGG